MAGEARDGPREARLRRAKPVTQRPYHHRRSTETQKAFHNRGLDGCFLVTRLASASRTTVVGWVFGPRTQRGFCSSRRAAHGAGAGVFSTGKRPSLSTRIVGSSRIAGPAIET